MPHSVYIGLNIATRWNRPYKTKWCTGIGEQYSHINSMKPDDWLRVIKQPKQKGKRCRSGRSAALWRMYVMTTRASRITLQRNLLCTMKSAK